MSDTFFEAIVFIIGFLVGLGAVALIRGLYKRKHKDQQEYDERQILARNSAYKWSFFSLVAYCILCVFMDLLELRWAEFSVQLLIGVLLSAVIFVGICIFKDAYFTKKGNTITSFLVFSVIMAVVQTCMAVLPIFRDGPLVEGGILTLEVVNILCAVVFYLFSAMTVIKIIMNKRVREEE